jgi:hypothetical protein
VDSVRTNERLVAETFKDSHGEPHDDDGNGANNGVAIKKGRAGHLAASGGTGEKGEHKDNGEEDHFHNGNVRI